MLTVDFCKVRRVFCFWRSETLRVFTVKILNAQTLTHVISLLTRSWWSWESHQARHAYVFHLLLWNYGEDRKAVHILVRALFPRTVLPFDHPILQAFGGYSSTCILANQLQPCVAFHEAAERRKRCQKLALRNGHDRIGHLHCAIYRDRSRLFSSELHWRWSRKQPALQPYSVQSYGTLFHWRCWIVLPSKRCDRRLRISQNRLKRGFRVFGWSLLKRIPSFSVIVVKVGFRGDASISCDRSALKNSPSIRGAKSPRLKSSGSSA